MAIQYDPRKAAANFEKHGVSFADAEGVMHDPLALTVEDVAAVGEPRFVTIGLGGAGDLLVVIYTSREDGQRIISARRATGRERKIYEG